MEKLMYREKEYNLRTSDFDYRDRIKISSILDLFQEIAGQHALELGCGYDETIKNNEVWLLVRQKLEILGELKPNTKVKVCTWPRKKDRLYFDRDYLIKDENDNIMVKSSSRWIVCNYLTRRISRAKDIYFNSSNYYEKRVFEKDVDKLQFDAPALEEKGYTYLVEHDDLDHNGHMNNIVYAKMMLNMAELKDDVYVKDFQIEFMHECLLGDKVVSYSKKENNTHYFYGYLKDKLSYKIVVNTEVK